MTKSFDRFLAFLATIPDRRRAEGKRYEQRHVLLFSILAIVTGANSYRGIRRFIRVHRPRLNRAFGLRWKKPPAHASIRTILSGLDGGSVERVFREHAADLNAAQASATSCRLLALGGKVLKGSFDNFHDSKAGLERVRRRHLFGAGAYRDR